MSRARVFPIIMILGCFLLSCDALQAEDSPVSMLLEKSKALVSIQSVNTAVFAEKPQGFIDRARGMFYILKRARPIGYARTGSGVILDPKGIIVTNAHTVTEAGGIEVVLYNGTKVPCNKVLVVPNTDIAFLSIEPPFELSTITFADMNAAVIGQDVYTVGHSDMLKGSLIGGQLLGIKKDPVKGVPMTTYLRVTFSVYKGDSGSPVLNKKGELLGIVSAGQEGRMNATFAVSAEVIQMAYHAYCQEPQKNISGKAA